jgi:MoaA/NifB/PqqE/SkfB family radical SAM enzyme
MYGIKNYINRGALFANNNLRPGKKKLSTLMFYATDLCDSGCKHCLIWAKRPVKHLPLAKIKEVMKSDCVTKNTMVGLEGGEFLLHPEAMEIMEWLTKNHPNFDLLSNCLKPDLLIEAVKKYPPKRLYISLDGDKETYKYMRGKDGYDSVIKVIENLKDVVPISTMFTLSPYNDFEDMRHVAEICKEYGVDMRVGVYNDIAFFDTVEKAHETEIGTVKNDEVYKFGDVKRELGTKAAEKNTNLSVLEKEEIHTPKHNELTLTDEKFKERIPQVIKEFKENYDFLVLYDEWRKKELKLNCYSILDSLVILPDGGVPICQNLDLQLGNVNEKSLDDVFNGKYAQDLQKDHVHNCNQCWINFHRKYDVVLYRSMEKFFPKWAINKMFGYYQWESSAKTTYSELMDKMEDKYGE